MYSKYSHVFLLIYVQYIKDATFLFLLIYNVFKTQPIFLLIYSVFKMQPCTVFLLYSEYIKDAKKACIPSNLLCIITPLVYNIKKIPSSSLQAGDSQFLEVMPARIYSAGNMLTVYRDVAASVFILCWANGMSCVQLL